MDLSGYWLEGDVLHVGRIEVGKDASVGARSTLFPGARIGARAHIEPGSAVTGAKKVKAGSQWAGSPAVKVGKARNRFPEQAAPRRTLWFWLYALSAIAMSFLPLVALFVAAAFVLWLVPVDAPLLALPIAAVGGLVAFATYAALTWLSVRLLSTGLKPGVVAVRSLSGWRVWAVERLMDSARTQLFPMYAAQLTPLWFRSLGAKVGKDAEISTAVMVPRFAEVREGAFLADDTMVGGYELGLSLIHI